MGTAYIYNAMDTAYIYEYKERDRERETETERERKRERKRERCGVRGNEEEPDWDGRNSDKQLQRKTAYIDLEKNRNLFSMDL